MLIIYSHPNHDGHCGYILQKVCQHLDQQKKSYQILDLYQMNFDPVLPSSEHYTSGHRDVAESIKNFQNLLLNETELIVIYPTWWNSPPAILKGFFDRVLTSHYAFKYVGNMPQGLLTGKKALVITTTGGPAWYEVLLAQDRSLNMVVNDTLKFCGIQTKGHRLASSTKFTDERKQIIDKKVEPWLSFFS